MTDELPENEALNLNADGLASIRAAAHAGLEVNADASTAESAWPKLPDESYRPDEIADAFGDPSAYDPDDLDDEAVPTSDDVADDETFSDDEPDPLESDAPQNSEELNAFIESMDAQSAELQRQARQLAALERKIEDGPRECVLA